MPWQGRTKARGSAAERELVHLFWDAGWAAFRAPASGAMQHDLPDVIAGHGNRKLAIEAKLTTKDVQYLTKEEVASLVAFTQRFGCEAWIGVKFSRRGWRFLAPEDLRVTQVSHAVTFEEAKARGLTFEELVR